MYKLVIDNGASTVTVESDSFQYIQKMAIAIDEVQKELFNNAVNAMFDEEKTKWDVEQQGDKLVAKHAPTKRGRGRPRGSKNKK